jgi:hypothetical protein
MVTMVNVRIIYRFLPLQDMQHECAGHSCQMNQHDSFNWISIRLSELHVLRVYVPISPAMDAATTTLGKTPELDCLSVLDITVTSS